MFEKNPAVDPAKISANSNLVGMSALQIFDQVVTAIIQSNMMVVLDNHNSDADWYLL
jgi:hypothetical protein